MIVTQIEAKEACDWLRAAGFPQYAQLYEDLQFPIDIETVKNDHEFLDRDAMESLYRRLNTLNKCATMKVEISRNRKRSDESEEDEPCAISNKWSYQRQSQRWSRLEDLDCILPDEASSLCLPHSTRLKCPKEDATFLDQGEKNDASSLHSSSSGESDSFQKPYEELETSRSSSRCSSVKLISVDSTCSLSPSPSEMLNIICEEKVLEKPPSKKGKSLIRKMEKLRLRSSTVKRNVHPKNKPTISGPVLLDGIDEDKLRNLNCVNISDLSDIHSKEGFSCSSQTCSSSSPSENSSAVSTPSPIIRVRSHMKRGGIYAEDFDPSKLSLWHDISEQNFRNERHSHENQLFQIPQGHKPGTFPKALTNSILSPIDNTSVNWRTGSFHGCNRNKMRSSSAKDAEASLNPVSFFDNRLSIYDNVPNIPFDYSKFESPGDDDVFSELDNVMEHVNGLRKLVSEWSEKFSDDGDSDFANDSISPCPSSPKTIHLEVNEHLHKSKTTDLGDTEGCKPCTENSSPILPYITISEIGSSLTDCSRHSPELENLSMQVDSQSSAHLNRIQKLALLKLTALMDKYSPSSKQGWNWNVPKFIRKIRAPDYKDKNVFGVPFLLNVQRTGHPIPKSIHQAMEYLRIHFLDQVGLFRKSGVKSRIQSLREMNELNSNFVNYEGQSAFDVADMVKQYFRDLPEPIFTSKLCESFLHIYQYLPKEQQFHAVQAAILLLPDENREALKILLCFLRDVVACVNENQMSPTNIAVCLAPSLFHLNTLRRESSSSSRSSQRKYSLGKPDQKDLSENLAATQGLAHMIADCSRLFQAGTGWDLAVGALHLRCQSLPVAFGTKTFNLPIVELKGTDSAVIEMPALEDVCAVSRCLPARKLPDYCRDLYPSICEAPPRPSEVVMNTSTTSLAAHCNTLISLENSMQNLLRDAKDKYRSWVSCSGFEHVELSYKKVESDDYPIRLWKVSTEIEAKPQVILQHIIREQHTWDPHLQQSKIIETLDEDTEIYHYSTESMPPLPSKDFVVLRTWRTDPQSGTCILAATSIECEDAPVTGVLGHVILCQHLIENLGTQKCKVTHVCRTDTRGHTTEWYNRVFGHMCAAEILRIKDSFLKKRAVKT